MSNINHLILASRKSKTSVVFVCNFLK